ncbi:MAG: phytanoyl-CoA dioxygenase family protein [Caulobacterales bacterium]
MTAAEVAAPPLPSPTRDMVRAFEDLERFGYAVVEGALTSAQTAALRERVVQQARGEDARGEGFHDGKTNQRIWMLPNKGRIFRDLMLHPLVDEAMGRLLGPDFLLSSLTANIARPGGAPMFLHSDQGYVDFWTPKPLVANIAWMLDDFTEANGGTRLVPGSHLIHQRREYALADSVAAEGPAGGALVFDGRLMHGTGANLTEGEHRHAILSYHCRPFVRQQENFFLGLDPLIRRTEREAVLHRMGFSIWAGLGRTNAPGDKSLLEPLERPLGALDESGRPLLED